jgi:hypothetical protein
MLGETLGKKIDIVSIVKPNAPLSSVVEDFVKLGKNFTKQDHIVIVGGPERAWIGIIITQQRRTSTSLRRGQPKHGKKVNILSKLIHYVTGRRRNWKLVQSN